MTKPTIFISYSHEDEEWLTELREMLDVAFEDYDTSVLTDKDIVPGENWEDQLNEAMAKATLAILLVSVKSLRSEFIRKKEIPYLMVERQIPVIPIIIRPCPWQHQSWLNQLQVLPKDGKPLAGRGKYEIEDEMTKIASLLVKMLYPDTFQKSSPLRGDRSRISSTPQIQNMIRNQEDMMDRPHGIRPLNAGYRGSGVTGDTGYSVKGGSFAFKTRLNVAKD